jgi:hypothetical protein
MRGCRAILWRRRLADDLALGGFMEKPPARRRRHEVPAPSDNFRSFTPAQSIRREKRGLVVPCLHFSEGLIEIGN